MNYQIIHLPKEQWQNHILPMGYTTTQYYDVVIDQKPTGFNVNIELKDFDEPVTHSPDEYDFPDRLYQEFWPEACAWGVVDNGELVAAIETCPEEWSNRLRITELWVHPAWQKKGVGHALMEVAKTQARLENRRAIMLETQSCNVNAIGFYLHEDFTLMGLDTCCYNNRDLERKEVRIELAWFPKRTELKRENVEIRQERPEEHHAVEVVVREAFWNKFRQGCDEHLLVHKLRESDAYLPQLSRILIVDGEIAGAIFYAKAWVDDGKQKHEVLSFGPLAVAPKWKGCGVGSLLMEETHKLAKEEGYPAIVITGVPTYYPRFGYKPAGDFGLTVDGGKTFPAFMAYELYEGALENIKGEFHEADVFFDLPKEELEAFEQQFEKKDKLYFPKQW